MKKTVLVLLVIVLQMVAFGQNKTGTAGVTSLKFDPSARANALGGAYIALAEGADALAYNPAGMIQNKGIDVVASYMNYIDGISYTYLGGVKSLSVANAIGAQLYYMSTGDMDETTPTNPTGTGRTFQSYDLVLGLSYAQMLRPNFYVGGTLKYIQEQLAPELEDGKGSYIETAIAGDVGTYYNTGWKSLIFGMSIRNFGNNMKFIKEETPLPMTFVFGVGFTPLNDDVNRVNLLIEAGHPSDNGEYVVLGAEYIYKMGNNSFSLRAGRKIDGTENALFKDEMNKNIENSDYSKGGFNLNGTACGLGMKFGSFKMDYSFEHYGYLGFINMVSLGYELK